MVAPLRPVPRPSRPHARRAGVCARALLNCLYILLEVGNLIAHHLYVARVIYGNCVSDAIMANWQMNREPETLYHSKRIKYVVYASLTNNNDIPLVSTGVRKSFETFNLFSLPRFGHWLRFCGLSIHHVNSFMVFTVRTAI